MIRIPLKTVSALNTREHWAKRATRVRKEREAARLLTPNHLLPCVVTMTRESPGTLDDDNLRGALKGVRDGIADKLGIDDRDPRVEWRYAQARAKEFAVLVQIEPRV